MKPIKARKVITNGKTTWCVDLRSLGKNRLFFQDKASADAEAFSRQSERLNHGLRGFDLEDADRTAFLNAKERLAKVGATIDQAVELFLKIGPVKESKPLVEAVASLIEDRRRANKRPRYVRQLEYCLSAFIKGREAVHCADVTRASIEEWLNGSGWAPKTRLGKLTDVRTLFSFAKEHGWCSVSPCPPVDITVDHAPPGILTPAQAANLMGAAQSHEPTMIPFIAIGLFAGIRPEELMRLTWADIDLRAGLVRVPAASSKTRKLRYVKMSDNLKAWLRVASEKQIHTINHKRKFNRVRKLAGVPAEKWPHDAMRHSFASYHLAKHGAQDATATQLGHADATMLFSNYRQLVKPADAKRFWAIKPKTSAKIIQMPANVEKVPVAG